MTATIAGLSPGTKDHYRLVATNAAGATAAGLDRNVHHDPAPGDRRARLGEPDRDHGGLNAQVNPTGSKRPTNSNTARRPDTGSGAGARRARSLPRTPTRRSASTRRPGAPRRLPLRAGRDQRRWHDDDRRPHLQLLSASCPNENVRQQTQTNYLPDCRAYELVSPGDAGGTSSIPAGPTPATPRARRASPSPACTRRSRAPAGSPIDGNGDLYVATRTDTGWVTRYVGLPSDQAAVDGGPPLGPPASGLIVGVNDGNGSSNESTGRV